jgi:hypothetical protein
VCVCVGACEQPLGGSEIYSYCVHLGIFIDNFFLSCFLAEIPLRIFCRFSTFFLLWFL